MVNLHAALIHHFLELPVADRIGHVPADAPQDHVPLEMATLELNHHLPPYRTSCRRSYTAAVSGEDLRQNLVESHTNMEVARIRQGNSQQRNITTPLCCTIYPVGGAVFLHARSPRARIRTRSPTAFDLTDDLYHP
jgi:hypothetical protein